MEAASAGGGRFEHLREHSIGLPEVLFQSITHMAPAAAVATRPLHRRGASFAGGLRRSRSCLAHDRRASSPRPRWRSSHGCSRPPAACTRTPARRSARGSACSSPGASRSPAARHAAPLGDLGFDWCDFCRRPLEHRRLARQRPVDGSGWILMTVVVLLLTIATSACGRGPGVVLGDLRDRRSCLVALCDHLRERGDLQHGERSSRARRRRGAGVFQGMVFALLAFIGFEAAAPLGEEPRTRVAPSRAPSSGRRSRRAVLCPLLVRVGLRRLRQLRQPGDDEP